jgi:hypothetical protein
MKSVSILQCWKNLVDVLASIGIPVDDEDLMAMMLNGLGKDHS